MDATKRDRLLSLATALLEGSVDRIDGLFDLGREVSGSVGSGADFRPDDFPALVGVADDLDSVPREAQRDLWDREAYAGARAKGAEVLGWYGDAIDPELRRLRAWLEENPGVAAAPNKRIERTPPALD